MLKDLHKIQVGMQILWPELFLLGGILLLTLVSSFQKRGKGIVPILSVGILVLYGIFLFNHQSGLDSSVSFYNFLKIDRVGFYFKELIVVSGLIFILQARFFQYEFENEIYLFVLLNIFGLLFVCMSTHLMVLFVVIELASMSSYLMVAGRKHPFNFEAALKYLLLGGTVMAIFLYGVSLVYGITLELDFSQKEFSERLQGQNYSVVVGLVGMVLGSIFFKVAAVPFHSWVPDVYQNTSTPLLSYLSFAPKAAGILLLSRWIQYVQVDIRWLLLFVIVASIAVGNITALNQHHIKKMLGYSTIAQIGFVMIGLYPQKTSDFSTAYFYMFNYLPISMGAFFLVDLLYQHKQSYSFKDYSGLGKSIPLLGLNAVVIMVALIGLPPTSGFLSKFSVFSNLLTSGDRNHLLLFTFGLLNTALSLYFYLKLPYYMFLKKGQIQTPRGSELIFSIVLSYFSLAIIYLFFFPEVFTQAIDSF